MRRLSTLLAAAVLSTTLAAPAHAVVSAAGFAWAYDPANPAYFLASGYEYNSAGLPIQITRGFPGTYQVKFFGMGTAGGVAHVSSYGSNALCTIASWTQAAADQIVNVRCYNNAGALIDSRFAVNFTNRNPGAGHFAYLWNDNPVPGPAGHTPAAAYSYDSTGAPMTVWRSAAGRYRVRVGAFQADSPGPWAAGYLRVTPYGAAARHCQILDPLLVPDEQLIEVRCYDDTGSAVDTRFTLTYSRNVAMLGGSGTRTTATVDLSGPGPVMRGWTNSFGGVPTATQIVPGTYEVVFPNAGNPKGHAIASIMGTPPMYCTIQSWWQAAGDQHLLVSCFDGNIGVPNPAVLLNVSFIG
ncbi:hypothetical protein [Catelliglobosispora koreensis]|uniref:hypothetical protein n=1 Tax=Catelliglobosispora koreensis TaxID=129052 RepID=UPI0003A2D2A2|nr:hypothetical protein [Catelliglobosispora koreensis]